LTDRTIRRILSRGGAGIVQPSWPAGQGAVTIGSFFLRASFAGCVLALAAAGASGENRVTFELRNARAEGGVYKAELWACPGTSVWAVGTSLISVSTDESVLDPSGYHDVEALDACPWVNNAGEYGMLAQLDLGGNLTSLVILYFSGGCHVVAEGTHIATFRWDIVDPSPLDFGSGMRCCCGARWRGRSRGGPRWTRNCGICVRCWGGSGKTTCNLGRFFLYIQGGGHGGPEDTP